VNSLDLSKSAVRLGVDASHLLTADSVHVSSKGDCLLRWTLGGGKEFGLQYGGGVPAWIYVVGMHLRASRNRNCGTREVAAMLGCECYC